MFIEYYLSHTTEECIKLIEDYAAKYNINFVFSDIIRPAKALTTLNDDDTSTVILQPDMTYDEKIQAVLHELEHITGNDFQSDLTADEIEYRRHNAGS